MITQEQVEKALSATLDELLYIDISSDWPDLGKYEDGCNFHHVAKILAKHLSGSDSSGTTFSEDVVDDKERSPRATGQADRSQA